MVLLSISYVYCLSPKSIASYTFAFFLSCSVFGTLPLPLLVSLHLPLHLHHGIVVTTTAQLHSTKPGLRFCPVSNPACSVLEIRDSEDLLQWSRLEIRLNTFRRSTIPQKQFIIFIIIIFFTKLIRNLKPSFIYGQPYHRNNSSSLLSSSFSQTLSAT